MAQLDDKLLNAIASALTLDPRNTLQSLAKAAGISRATLYRAAPTREKIIDLLEARSVEIAEEALAEADLENGDPLHGLSVVTTAFLEHREIYTFVSMQTANPGCAIEAQPAWSFFDNAMDQFFLRCQRLGLLRIDHTAAWLTDFHGSLLYAATRAINLGRLAPASALGYILDSFMHGAANRDTATDTARRP